MPEQTHIFPEISKRVVKAPPVKKRYLLLALCQLLLIGVSAILSRHSWGESDFQEGPNVVISETMRLSFYCLIGWLLTILIAIACAIKDRQNREIITLFLIVVLPSISFFAWFFFLI
jgi:hypothetical protein